MTMMQLQRIETRRANDLRPHPKNEEIYGDHADAELVKSIQEKGVLNPLLVTEDGRIISGHRRWDAAKRIGKDVPVVVFGSQDELEVLEALIESNRQRQKTNEQVGREYAVLKEVYHARESRQAGRPKAAQNGNAPSQEGGFRPSEMAAKELGVSDATAQRAERVVTTIDDLRKNGKAREAEQLRTMLNTRGARPALERAKEAGYIAVTERVKPEPILPSVVTLDEWKAMGASEQAAVLTMPRSKTSRFNFQEENNIEWALWSWNPVMGCLHNCAYCYARDIAMRFYPQKFAPAFAPERLSAPVNTQFPAQAETNVGYKNVFTCSMADLFGKWVPAEWIHAVLAAVAESPQWNFLFLTKFPSRLAEFEFPDNAWVGTSVDAQARVKIAEEAFENVRAGVKWLSCEPLLEPLEFSRLDLFDWIVIGGASRSTETPEFRPPRAWIENLEWQARSVGCKVYEKENLLQRVREYPGQSTNGHMSIPDEFKMGYLRRDIDSPTEYAKEFV